MTFSHVALLWDLWPHWLLLHRTGHNGSDRWNCLDSKWSENSSHSTSQEVVSVGFFVKSNHRCFGMWTLGRDVVPVCIYSTCLLVDHLVISNKYLSVPHSVLSLLLSRLRHKWLENEAFVDVRISIGNLVNTRDFSLFTAWLWFRKPKVRSSRKPVRKDVKVS